MGHVHGVLPFYFVSLAAVYVVDDNGSVSVTGPLRPVVIRRRLRLGILGAAYMGHVHGVLPFYFVSLAAVYVVDDNGSVSVTGPLRPAMIWGVDLCVGAGYWLRIWDMSMAYYPIAWFTSWMVTAPFE